MHSSLIGKVEKANRYARELDRITFDRLSITFRGDNDTHHVSLDAGQWRCTCHYFESWPKVTVTARVQDPRFGTLRTGCPAPSAMTVASVPS